MGVTYSHVLEFETYVNLILPQTLSLSTWQLTSYRDDASVINMNGIHTCVGAIE